MKVQEAVALVTELVTAYNTALQSRQGVQGPQAYEASSILKAANTIADRIADNRISGADDDIPF